MKISENKPHSIHLRLSDEQYEFCQGTAELLGVSVSEFLRMTVNSLVVQQKRLYKENAEKLETFTADDEKLGDLIHENNKNDIEH